jgi:lysyl-tRNA synthetase class 2
LFENKYIQQRIEKAEKLREAGINPYSNESFKDSSISNFLTVNNDVFDIEEKRDENRTFTVAGRIKLYRLMGKASFIKIEDETGMLQVYVARDNLPENFYNDIFKKNIEVGDIVEVKGYPFITGQGELSLHADDLKLLTKAISPLPEKYHGIQDKELRYRQRYLDLIMNSDVRKTFHTRSKVISLTRRFFEDKGFLEVETPMMHPIAGGANAKPFVTHHNALGIDRFLRIAPELYLKRCIVGGFEAVFEINRNFRNEGMDQTHNPEFTMIEFYWAYHNYHDLMHLTEEMFDVLLKKLKLPRKLPYGEMEIDFSKPFRKIAFRAALSEIGGVPDEILDDRTQITQYINNKGFSVEANLSLGKLYEELFDLFVEEKLINPTFIIDYPIEISPLARRSETNPNIAERFELFIAGREIANGFNELNDPLDQYERFAKQLQAKNAGDDEAHEMDEDYVYALGYGLPPTAGQGLGIDRLTMLLTNELSIKDVILFPAMKPLNDNDEQTQKDEE